MLDCSPGSLAQGQRAIRLMPTDAQLAALDSLLDDLPPGTGDARLCMAQRVPLAAVKPLCWACFLVAQYL
jgi:Mrp family chromosome partitioning ATPase